MDIRRIEPEDTYAIRADVLRNNTLIKSPQFKGDHEESSFHLGGFHDGKLVSIASFYVRSNKKIEDPIQIQIRGMATIPEFRGKGLSQELIKTALPIVKMNQATCLWCNARTMAQGFYEKVGFNSLEDIYDIGGIGPHQLMKYSIV
ncbi:GNAT family N-acetyltransferase [Bacteriovoracaceae bacterium]|nr:GNAT family N-acetyltransferase [Bacteriovoracaceae bacterium]